MNKSYPRRFLPVLLALGFTSTAALAVPKGHVKERGSISIDLALQATVAAPVGATATGEIEVVKSKFNRAGTASLSLTTTSLLPGNYSVDALLGTTPVHLGDFVIAAAAPGSVAAVAPVVLAIPAGVDAASISKVTISDALAVVVEGDATTVAISWKYIANVPVIGGETPVKGHKAKRVHGHAVSHSFISDGVETKRSFLWVAFGAPASVELTINVDGVPTGVVTSTSKGKVMFKELAESVVLRDVSVITLTDSLGAVVMQAAF